MLNPRCFTNDWLTTKAEEMAVRDRTTFEKCVLALELVSRMAKEGLDFVFKGGTSLALLLDPIRRLSIDVDILSAEPLKRVTSVLESATRNRPPFIAWEHQERRDRESPPTRHFRATYQSAFGPAGRGPPSIQLDLITAENPYARLVRKPMRASFFDIAEEVEVTLPSVSSLLGDKLATFAPSTIGYLYQPLVAETGQAGEPRPIKVVKHLFDIGELAPVADNLAETLTTYRQVHAQQLKYRDGSWTVDDTLDDTLDASFWVSRIDVPPREENDKTKIFRQGIRALDSHLFRQPFRFPEARLAAGRAALTATLMKRAASGFNLPIFCTTDPDPAALQDATLSGRWMNLNRLKQTNIKAFACWFQAQNVL